MIFATVQNLMNSNKMNMNWHLSLLTCATRFIRLIHFPVITNTLNDNEFIALTHP